MSTADTADTSIARACWRTLEPYHGMIYFAPEAAEAYAAVGVEGRSGYFASRAAPMGAVAAGVVRATFFNFHPRLVAEAMKGVWDQASPAALIEARLAAVDGALRRMVPDLATPDTAAAMAETVDRLRPAVDAACTAPEGRPLFAGHASLPEPDEAHLALWHAITLLREFRGDGHIAALTEAGLSGVEALLLHGASGEVPMATLQTTRAWPDDEWHAAADGLRDRGLLDGDSLSTEGTALRSDIEARTDALAMPAWGVLDPDVAATVRRTVRPWSKAIAAAAFG